jgi:hypothetical protein
VHPLFIPLDYGSHWVKVLTGADVQKVTAAISAPSPQFGSNLTIPRFCHYLRGSSEGTLNPTIAKSVANFSKIGTRGLYALYSATVPPVPNIRQTTLDLTAHAGASRIYQDEFRRIAL